MRKRLTKMAPTLGYISLTVTMSREGDVWVGVCKELGVSTFDESLDTLLNELKALIAQHLNALERNGVRDDFFKKHGIHIQTTPIAEARLCSLRVASGTVVTRLTQRIPALAGAQEA
jgi:predicted RNase H-like HicB family nuclease